MRSALAGLALAALAACTGHDDHAARAATAADSPGAATRAASAATATAAGTAAAAVDMPRSYLFRPETLEVAVGTRVTWTNSDVFTHSVRLAGGGGTPPLRPGESGSYEFGREGTFAYDCPFHPQMMKGVVRVRR
jgi:plastocyanin